MTEKQISEGNKLMAEFMGFQPFPKYHYECKIGKNPVLLPPFAMKFHESWDWLMPVVNKINSLNLDKKSMSLLQINIHEAVSWVTLSEAYKAVLDFIIVRNNIKK